MSKKDDAMKLALEALVAAFQGKDKTGQVTDAIAAIREALASAAKEQPAKDEFQAAYIEAMVASNEAGFAGMSAAETIRELSRMVAEQPAQQQEPVAVYVGETWCGSVVRLYEDLPLETPLYTSPQSKPWVGLTMADKKEIERVAVYVDGAIRLAEAKLREKNT